MLIKIKTSQNNDAFILEPLDFELKEIRGLKMYVKNLNSGYINDNEIIIPFENADILELYHKIEKLFADRFSCEIVNDNNSSEILNKAIQEEENFKKFSLRACEIRNNNVDSDELNQFLECIKKENFKRTLEPFQLLSAYHLAFSQNACNFSVPGSGKTTTVLAAYAFLKQINDYEKRVNKLVVLGPLSSFIAWKKEYKFCFGRDPKYIHISGGVSDKTIEDVLLSSYTDIEMILVSYGSVSRREEMLKLFMSHYDCMVVLDEAHRIKNVDDGVQSSATLALSPYCKSRVILTGTPAPNGYVDLYNLYKFIWPSHNVIGYSIPQLANMSKNDSDSRVDDLISRIEPFFIRIKKTDLKLPEATFNPPIEVEMSPLQKIIYDSIAKMAISKMENSSISSYLKRAASIRMRQAATNPSLLTKAIETYCDSYEYFYEEGIDENQDLVFDSDLIDIINNYKNSEVPNKFKKVYELVQSKINNNEKVIIWCEFVGTCDYLSEYLTSKNINNKILYGGTDPEEREKIIDEFTDEENKSSFNIVIANPHAVGESISLHSTCHNAIYFEQGFNAGTYMQSKDRIHRVGLKPTDYTNYYFLHSIGTIDDDVYKRVLKKEERMIEIIESKEIPLISENIDFEEDFNDDIKAIIRGYYDYRNNNI